MGAPRIFPANAGEGFFSSGIVDNFNFHLLHTHSAVYFKISCESEPIFGYQCVPNWTAGDSIADMVSQYRPAPEYLNVSVLQYLSIWVSPPPPVCHHRSQREHLCQSTSYPPNPVTRIIPLFHFPFSPLLLLESHPNCSVWELDLFSLPSQPPLSMSCPQCTSSPHYWVFVRFPAPRTPVGGQVAKITTQLFGRDSGAITAGSAPVIPKHPPRGVDKLDFNRFEASSSLIICKHSSHLLPRHWHTRCPTIGRLLGMCWKLCLVSAPNNGLRLMKCSNIPRFWTCLPR